MASTTIRVSERTGSLVRKLAHESGETMQNVVDAAIEEFRRKKFFEEVNASYAALQMDPEAWAEELAERAIWDSTLADGIDRTEVWHDDGSVTYIVQESSDLA